MRTIVIDVKNKEVVELELDRKNELNGMREVVGGSICQATTLPNQDTIYVDDEGLLKGYENFFEYEGAHQPFAGNGIVIGTSEAGESISVKSTLEEIRAKVTFKTKQEIRDEIYNKHSEKPSFN